MGEAGGIEVSFDSFAAFMQMGKHGFYVWTAYGIALLVLALTFVEPVLTRKRLVRQLKQQQKREQTL